MISPEMAARYAEVPIELAVELGRTMLTLREILGLERNSLVRLSRSAGEKLDILMGGAPVGRGEIVVCDDSIAVRIGELREEA
jgi:flagellar motor switch protein FliN/FliY